MGLSSVPARRLDIEPTDLEPISFRRSYTPDADFLANPHSLIRERKPNDRVVVALLSGTAGYIDALGFIALMGMMPAHVTGEIIDVATMLTAGHHLSHPSRLAVLPTFVLSLFVAAVVARSRKRQGKCPARALFALMTGSLALATLTAGFGALHGPASFGWAYALRAGGIVAAMAFQNSLGREALGNACPTTVMTGNLTQIVFNVVDAVAARFSPETNEETHARPSNGAHLKLLLAAFSSFIVGALLAGYLTSVVGTLSVALPLIATVVAALRFG